MKPTSSITGQVLAENKINKFGFQNKNCRLPSVGGKRKLFTLKQKIIWSKAYSSATGYYRKLNKAQVKNTEVYKNYSSAPTGKPSLPFQTTICYQFANEIRTLNLERLGPTILTPKHRAGSSRERAVSFDHKTPTTETLRCPRPTEARREECKKPNSRYLENLKTRTNQTGRNPQKHLERGKPSGKNRRLDQL
ncbi:hypothetical protein J6590_082425 [Homalodisca vitripennis]|nr:hypothetical protein J6590_082425 [Homalodisca vitripennis]